MPPSLNILCLIAAGTYAASILFNLITPRRSRGLSFLESVLLAIYLVMLHQWTGFPHSQVPFSSSVSLGFLGALQLAVVAGILCSQAYHLNPTSPDGWFEIARPVMVAPLLLLPLLASLDSCGERTSLQNCSFLLLAFQNGFFWRSLFRKISKQEEQS